MSRTMVARLRLGLLLLVLLLSTQIYSNQTILVTPSSNPSQNISAAPNPANATIMSSIDAPQSTASLFMISVSLLHLCC
ncbi:signal transducer CD24-like [Phocoena sinus]|uniref:Signal transducer CD24-like n=1 Tax=Phocoena sinus TaxID=42100 RepID=A0A8C9CEM5_PHOSS|nr:signal transducer CD24-like [Phocoena sinus]